MPGGAAELPAKESAVLRGHEGGVLAVRFNSDGNYCLSCGKDRTLRLWNPHRSTHIKTYKAHGREVRDVHVTSYGNPQALPSFLPLSTDLNLDVYILLLLVVVVRRGYVDKEVGLFQWQSLDSKKMCSCYEITISFLVFWFSIFLNGILMCILILILFREAWFFVLNVVAEWQLLQGQLQIMFLRR